jgi:osmotically-inducible protein OsmY
VVSYGANTFLGPNYGNPLSLGMLNANGKATFGRVLYNTTTTATGTTGTGTATITRSTTATSTNINAIGVRRAPAYTASLGFPSRPTPPSAVLAEVQAVLDRSTRLPSRASIRAVMDGRVVVLQGMVQDDHERQLADSLVRLTPGVADVRNELSVRNPTPVETSQEP